MQNGRAGSGRTHRRDRSTTDSAPVSLLFMMYRWQTPFGSRAPVNGWEAAKVVLLPRILQLC